MRRSVSLAGTAVGPPPVFLRVAASMRPEASKARGKFPLGEDAYFLLRGSALGVADGVGSWAEQGVDAGEYSRALMRVAREKLAVDMARAGAGAGGGADLVGAMTVAEEYAKRFRGSSTFCLAAMEPGTHLLRGLVLGDSTLLVVRRGDAHSAVERTSAEKRACGRADPLEPCLLRERTSGPAKHERVWRVLYKSEEQQLLFNMPRQIGSSASVKASAAIGVTVPLRPGDIVVAGSDGVFDNLFVNDVLQIIARTFEETPCAACALSLRATGTTGGAPADPLSDEMDPDALRLAVNLTDAALRASQHASRKGPFAANSARAGYLHEGGKPDDVTAVVGIASCEPPVPAVSLSGSSSVASGAHQHHHHYSHHHR